MTVKIKTIQLNNYAQEKFRISHYILVTYHRSIIQAKERNGRKAEQEPLT